MICVKCWRKDRKLGLAGKVSGWESPEEEFSSSDEDDESVSSIALRRIQTLHEECGGPSGSARGFLTFDRCNFRGAP